MAHGLLLLLVAVGLGTAFYFFFANHDEHGAGRQYQGPSNSTNHSERVWQYNQCPICLESPARYDGVQVTPCMHIFHQRCIEEWREKGTRNAHLNCPVCRVKITGLEQL